jgi:hypothetical protein
MAELIWDGKYNEHRNKHAPVRIELPFQTVETFNESAQERVDILAEAGSMGLQNTRPQTRDGTPIAIRKSPK